MLIGFAVMFLFLLSRIIIDAFSFDSWYQRILHIMVWLPAWAVACYYVLLFSLRLELKVCPKMYTALSKKSRL